MGRQRRDHGFVGIGLYRNGDQRRLCANTRQRLAEHPEMALDGGGGIAVEGRAHRLRQFRERYVFGMEKAVAVIEMVHLVLSPAGAGRNGRRGAAATWAGGRSPGPELPAAAAWSFPRKSAAPSLRPEGVAPRLRAAAGRALRSEEHTSELQSLM